MFGIASRSLNRRLLRSTSCLLVRRCRSNISTVAELNASVERMKVAQSAFKLLSQEETDALFKASALECSSYRVQFAKAAVDETQLGVFEDKIIKNHVASEFVYKKYQDLKTCGVIYDNEADGVQRIAQPIGPIAAITPVTNPTSTIIFKSLLALKTRNCIFFSPHPKAKQCCKYVVDVLKEVGAKNGAPADWIDIISEPSLELTEALIAHGDMKFVLATGGEALTQFAMKSGKPAITGGPGNTPVIVGPLANVKEAVHALIISKTFDNGTLCPSEQNLFVVDSLYDAFVSELKSRNVYICRSGNKADRAKLRTFMFKNNKSGQIVLNADIVGQKASKIVDMCGLALNSGYKTSPMIAVEMDAESDFKDDLYREKLSPVLTLTRVRDVDAAIAAAKTTLYSMGGIGHTATFFTHDTGSSEGVDKFKNAVPSCHLLVNMPASLGCVGDIYNFGTNPSLTIGCGALAGNAFAGNLEPKMLIEEKTLLSVRENMQWFKNPPKIYFKYGILEKTLSDFQLEGLKRAFIVSDPMMLKLGFVDRVVRTLNKVGIECTVFTDVTPNPTKGCILQGVKAMEACKPDHIIGLGGGSPMDAAKVMRLLYEYPEVQIEDLYVRFLDIRKRINQFPYAYNKVKWSVMIPTTSGTGSEVTPFAVVTDEESPGHQKYPICSYSMTPTMAIVDSELCMSMPKKLTAFTGFDALVHAIESHVSVFATDFTKPLSLRAIQMVFEHLPISYTQPDNIESRQKMHNASCIAGLAFSNAFLGICHSLAHKLGAAFEDLPHGLANALLICQVIQFNGVRNPYKSTPFAQYKTYQADVDYGYIADSVNYHLHDNSRNDGTTQTLIELLEALKTKLDIPKSIKECGIPEATFLAALDEMVVAAWDDQCTGTNPRSPLMEEIKQIYINAYHGITNYDEQRVVVEPPVKQAEKAAAK